MYGRYGTVCTLIRVGRYPAQQSVVSMKLKEIHIFETLTYISNLSCVRVKASKSVGHHGTGTVRTYLGCKLVLKSKTQPEPVNREKKQC